MNEDIQSRVDDVREELDGSRGPGILNPEPQNAAPGQVIDVVGLFTLLERLITKVEACERKLGISDVVTTQKVPFEPNAYKALRASNLHKPLG